MPFLSKGQASVPTATIIVRKYRGERAFEVDARRWQAQGYEVFSVTSETPGRGCDFVLLAMLTLGFWLLLTHPQPLLVVTYRRAGLTEAGRGPASEQIMLAQVASGTKEPRIALIVLVVSGALILVSSAVFVVADWLGRPHGNITPVSTPGPLTTVEAWQTRFIGLTAEIGTELAQPSATLPATSTPYAFPTPSPRRALHLGDEGRVYVAGGNKIAVAVDEQSFEELVHIELADDMLGLTDMLLQGRAFAIANNTRIKVIDLTITKTKIRVLEGQMIGQAGWVPAEWVSGS